MSPGSFNHIHLRYIPMQIDTIRHYFTRNLATCRRGGIQRMSPLPKESLKIINFLQHETSQARTHLKLAEILCRQKNIPNEKCSYNIFIFESSVVKTQFWGSSPVLKFLLHGPAYHSLFHSEIGAQLLLPILFPYNERTTGLCSPERNCLRTENGYRT